ncbi:MAG TPA: DUF6285 domain-containing protein [Acidimicrobiales bacterium]|nr:DUF6285 domain-containing protein [Acidimicrobiales bacterium]
MSELHGRPTSEELVEAVREFLENDVMTSTEGRIQFHTRVAVNVLGMVQREIEMGPGQEAAHRVRLEALGFDDDTALADAIRNGDVDDRYEEIKAAVYDSVIDKLKVANPKYLDT